jgi:hypothetical protein
MLALSVGMAWLSANRSVAQNTVVAAVAVAIITGGLMGLLAALTRLASEPLCLFGDSLRQHR